MSADGDITIRPDIAARLDDALCQVSVEYASKRQTLRLGPVKLAVLPPSLLADRDRRLRRQRSRTSEQFKHQYLLPRPGLDEDLGYAKGGSALD